MFMDAKAAQQERMELFSNAFQFKKNKRVPLGANCFTWKLLDAGYKLNEILYDYNKMEKVYEEFHERYQFDAYSDMGVRNPVRMADLLSEGYHKIDPTGETIIIDDHHTMEREDYEELAKNPMSFYWTKAFKRYCRPGITMEKIAEAVKEYTLFMQYGARNLNTYLNKFGAVIFSGITFVKFPCDSLFTFLRGMKEFSLDIRKCKERMKETMEAMFVEDFEPLVQKAIQGDYTGYIAPISILFQAQTVMSRGQFEELYWPQIKKVLDTMAAHKKTVYCFCEGAMLQFAEFFQDIPKGLLMVHLEQDNIFEFRKRLPNIALAGGMPVDLLGHGTKEQCVDYAKKLIDTLGDGFVLSQDKMMSSRNDAKRENLLAVNEFAKNYQY
jgi:hypothetical protein